MKKVYGAPQMEMICVDADIIRTSVFSLWNAGKTDEGVGVAQDEYNFWGV